LPNPPCVRRSTHCRRRCGDSPPTTSAVVGGTATAAGPAAVAVELAAVAVELVHNFSLVHDDVMDGDLIHRHRPTAWSVFGINAAILLGDALLTLALKRLQPRIGSLTIDSVNVLIGLLFSIILAFVISGVLGDYHDARSDV
jgi:Polyprenyl synthetase